MIMEGRKALLARKRRIDSEIAYLFYIDDLQDRLMRIRQAQADIARTGHLQTTADDHIDPYFWPEEHYAHLTQVLKEAEALYCTLMENAK